MIRYLFFFLLFLNIKIGFSQQQSNRPDLKVVFYNVENFFDWIDDPRINDEEFLPDGSRRWTKSRFEDKASNIFKVFASMGQFSFPDIIGMAEVENAFVINYLIQQTPMKKVPMASVHRESRDPRGIDNCILYRTDRLKLIRKEFINIIQKNNTVQQTRDIVYASFQTKENDVLHVFVNHWPSRSGGELETQRKRNHVASILKQKIDSVLKVDHSAKIIITGDFNDEPFNASISKILMAQSPVKISDQELYNLAVNFKKEYGTGTLKYRGTWSVFDQFIVSGSLLTKKGTVACSTCAGVYNSPFLLVDDKTHMGVMPWRTFNGMKYTAGFSDHLPIYLNLYFNTSSKN